MAIYIALGANLGDRQANLADALRRMEPEVTVDAVSALYESPPQPPAPPPAYLNAAARVVTDLSPAALLAHLKRIEREMGRTPGERWAPRPIDLDIVLFHDEVLHTAELTVPHPRIEERAFVLRPLLDLDAELRHPVTGERLEAVLRRLGESELVRIAVVDWWDI